MWNKLWISLPVGLQTWLRETFTNELQRKKTVAEFWDDQW